MTSLLAAGDQTSGSARMVTPRASVYLHAGQLFASPVPTDVTTILGSCVAVCLYEESVGIGGINHFMLPSDSAAQSSPRYARYAIDKLIEQLTGFGVRSRLLQAKLFGGACVLQPFQKSGSNDLGTRNFETAQRILQELAIPIVSQDVGGTRGRKLLFATDSGVAHIKQLSS